MNIKDINDFILNMEKELDLFDFKVLDVFAWKLIRVQVSNSIRIKTGILGVGHSKNKQTLKAKIKALPFLLWNTYVHGVGSRRRKVDTLVFEHPRKLFIDGEYRDIYTDPVVKDLESSDIGFELVDHPMLRTHFNKPSFKRSYLEHEYIFGYIKSFFDKVTISKEDNRLLVEINNRILNKYGIDLKILDKAEKAISKFKREEKFYLRLFKKREVKTVFLVVSYGKEALISACHKLNIKCIELQHGQMSTYHLGYHFPARKVVPYFPNELRTFGKFWSDSVDLPLPKEDVVVTGYSYLNNKLKDFINLPKVDNQVLFISQGSIGKELSRIAKEYAKEDSDKKVIYKLHPGEYSRWREDYPWLNDIPENMLVVDNNNIELYQYLAESTYIVGVYSTALYEALSLGCRTVIVDLPGYQNLNALIDMGLVVFFKASTMDLGEAINSSSFKEIDKKYFFY